MDAAEVVSRRVLLSEDRCVYIRSAASKKLGVDKKKFSACPYQVSACPYQVSAYPYQVSACPYQVSACTAPPLPSLCPCYPFSLKSPPGCTKSCVLTVGIYEPSLAAGIYEPSLAAGIYEPGDGDPNPKPWNNLEWP